MVLDIYMPVLRVDSLKEQGKGNREGGDNKCPEKMQLGDGEGGKESRYHGENDRVQDEKIQNHKGGEKR